jgi:hypothetical protein
MRPQTPHALPPPLLLLHTYTDSERERGRERKRCMHACTWTQAPEMTRPAARAGGRRWAARRGRGECPRAHPAPPPPSASAPPPTRTPGQVCGGRPQDISWQEPTRCTGKSQPKRPHTRTQTSQRTTSTGSPTSSVAIPAVILSAPVRSYHAAWLSPGGILIGESQSERSVESPCNPLLTDGALAHPVRHVEQVPAARPPRVLVRGRAHAHRPASTHHSCFGGRGVWVVLH